MIAFRAECALNSMDHYDYKVTQRKKERETIRKMRMKERKSMKRNEGDGDDDVMRDESLTDSEDDDGKEEFSFLDY